MAKKLKREWKPLRPIKRVTRVVHWLLYDDAAGELRWRKTSANGQCIVASSEGFSGTDARRSCLRNAWLCGAPAELGEAKLYERISQRITAFH